MTWWAWAGLAALIAGLVWLAVLLAQRLGAAKAQKTIAEHSDDVQKRMAEADAAKPDNIVDLVDRLRKHGF